MNQQTITNFYVPGVSKRIFATLREISKCSDSESEEESKQEDLGFVVPHGIIDSSKRNLPYQKLIMSLGISDMANEDILKYVEKALISSFIIEKHSEFEIYEGDCDSGDDIDTFTNKKNKIVDAIYLWRHSKYSIKSIAAKLSIQKEMVCNILSKYKKNIKKLKHKRMKSTKGTRRSIDRDKLRAIKDY